mgnify:CR=1 FL=1
MGTFNKGLVKDTAHNRQPENTYNHALNAILKEQVGSICTEGGTIPAHWTSQMLAYGDFQLIGKVRYQDIHILFLKDVTNDDCVIGKFEKPNSQELFTEVFRTNKPASGAIIDTDLKFSIYHLIKGEANIDNYGDLIVYWIDDINYPRTLNIDKQIRSVLISGNTTHLYGIDPVTSVDKNYVDKLRLFPHSGPIPKIDSTAVLDGGSLDVGAYYLNLSYQDEDGSMTGNLATSLPVALSVDSVGVVVGSPSINKDTSSPIAADKAIKWTVTNINIEQEYLVPYIVIDKGDEERTAVKLPKIKISEFVNLTTRSVDITWEGSEGEFGVSLSEVYDVKFPYKTAKAIEQFKDRLYLGNLTVDPILRYQKYANAIKLTPAVKSICDFDRPVDSYPGAGAIPYIEYRWWSDWSTTPAPDTVNNTNATLPSAKINSYKNPDYHVNYRGYKRGEVYAFYLAFVLNDGTLSPGYHIPGRDIAPSGTATIPELTSVADTEIQDIMDYNIQNYELYDTSTNIGSNFMGYWQNKDEVYPGTTDWDTTDYSLPTPFIGPSLQTTNVRHHRFPDTQSIEDPNNAGTFVPYAYNVIQDPSMACATVSTNITNAGGGKVLSESLITLGTYGGNTTPTDDATLLFIDSTGVLPHGVTQGVGGSGALIPGLPIVGETVSVSWTNIMGTSFVHQLPVVSVVAGVGAQTGGYVLELNTPTSWPPGNGPAVPTVFMQSTSITWSGGTYSQSGTGCDVTPCTTTSGDQEQSVSILGFKLDNLHIPKSIADQIQGFRIYRSKRRDADKTTIGQGPITKMGRVDKTDIGINNMGVSALFSLPIGDGNWRCNITALLSDPGGYGCLSNQHFAFSNQHLLRTRKEVDSSTHVKLLTTSSSANDEIMNFYGPHINFPINGLGTGYNVANYGPFENSNGGCPMALVSIFGFTLAYNTFQENVGSYAKIRDNAFKYIQGNTITNVDDDGFTKDFVFNMGSESHLALELWTKANFSETFSSQGGTPVGWDTSEGCGYATDPANQWSEPYWKVYTENGGINPGGLRYSDRKGDHHLKIIDVRSFKRNVYNSFDTMDLVWTGYEVLGPELDRFVVEDYSGAPQGINANDTSGLPNFTTGDIFGGDTFINRYWWRVTHDGMDLFKQDPDPFMNSLNNSTTVAGLHCNMFTGSQRGLFSVIIESEDNIDLRHSINESTSFYPQRSVKDMLYDIDGVCVGLGMTAKAPIAPSALPHSYLPTEPCLLKDLTNQETGTNAEEEEGIRYNPIYSAECDIGVTVPIIKDFKEILAYPARVIRSLEPTGIANTYRNYPEFDYLDIEIARGGIMNIFSLMDNIMIQTETSIFTTRGNETMSLQTGGNVFIGTGNVFEMPPKELVDTELGSGGTTLRYSGLNIASGRLYVNYSKRRIFLVTLIKDKKTGSATEGYEDITIGMENWFNANIPFTVLTLYGITNFDLPYTAIGFHTAFDQINKRFIITKRDVDLTDDFTSEFSMNPVVSCTTGEDTVRLGPNKDRFQVWKENPICDWVDIAWDNATYFTPTGWTMSYQLDMKVWASFHSYTPNMYLYLSHSYYAVLPPSSLFQTPRALNIYRHNSYDNIGSYYLQNIIYPFEVEYTTTGKSDTTKQFYAIEVNNVITDLAAGWLREEGMESPDNIKIQDIGFTSFYIYNRLQISGEVALVPLTSTVSGSGNYRSAGSSWLINNFRDESLLTATYAGGLPSYPSPGVSMFNADGTINTNYIDTTKTWDRRAKFVDKYVNIRLICDNSTGNFVTLLSSEAKFRPYFR